jgi:hypothetical protein
LQNEEKHPTSSQTPLETSDASPKQSKKAKKTKSFLETVREIDEKERLRDEALEEKRRQIAAQQKKEQQEAYEKKLRQDRIELMRLKQGVITESETIHEQKEEKPKLSVWKKIKNFFYHSKWWLWITVFLVFVAGYMVVDYVTQVKPDMVVMVLTDDETLQLATDNLSTYLEQYIEDTNGDGKVTVDIYAIPLNDETEANEYYTGDVTKLTTQFQMGTAVMLITDAKADEFILSDETLVNLEELFPDNPNVRSTGFYLRHTDFTAAIGYPDLVLDRDICISLRKVTKTYDSVETMQENYDIAFSALEKIMDDLPYVQKTSRTSTTEQ